ncbi:hypothetical protein FK85_27310 [Halorubrum saccharovorum]|uniref:DUF7577 domain-containing protein n=1 Tax=Halorubrum saccharovorum TaxID=2248 RepID=A0A0F8BHA5_9EURY|nr:MULTISPECIES: zinc ribbon domain-containing protein [Halorubrum]KKF39593.1 hypothetical protein FK85_27310 [Halorubrum saccharovorum]
MTGAEIAPLVAILGAVALINLAFAWLFTRGDRDPADFLGSAREVPEEAKADSEPSGDGVAGFTANAGESGESGPTGDPPPLDADGETVVCRHCGAENRTGYQFCRWCVRSGFVDDGAGGTAGAAMPNRSL